MIGSDRLPLRVELVRELWLIALLLAFALGRAVYRASLGTGHRLGVAGPFPLPCPLGGAGLDPVLSIGRGATGFGGGGVASVFGFDSSSSGLLSFW